MVFDVTTTELALRLVLATALGGVVGLERELTHRPAGLRTHMLVSLGAALFAIISTAFTEDPARIAAGIVTGIGFIGAGSIIAARGQVRGITTAASLWIVAAIGLTSGLGAYELAVFSAILVFLILQFGGVEKKVVTKRYFKKLISALKI